MTDNNAVQVNNAVPTNVTKIKITQERVFELADRLISQGIEPTNSKIRMANNNSGSLSSITPLLKAWREVRAKESLAPMSPIPQTLIEALNPVWAEMCREAELLWQEERTELQNALAASQGEQSALMDVVDQQDEELAALRAELAQLQEDMRTQVIELESEKQWRPRFDEAKAEHEQQQTQWQQERDQAAKAFEQQQAQWQQERDQLIANASQIATELESEKQWHPRFDEAKAEHQQQQTQWQQERDQLIANASQIATELESEKQWHPRFDEAKAEHEQQQAQWQQERDRLLAENQNLSQQQSQWNQSFSEMLDRIDATNTALTAEKLKSKEFEVLLSIKEKEESKEKEKSR